MRHRTTGQEELYDRGTDGWNYLQRSLYEILVFRREFLLFSLFGFIAPILAAGSKSTTRFPAHAYPS